jgi:hypothetical protein
MAVREFRDASGRRWRAWDVRPESIHPVTKAEDYLADCYVTGWIVFESFTGDEKRRLCPYPMRWTESSEDGLRTLLERAERILPHKLRAQREPAAETSEPTGKAATEPDVTDLEVVRSFRYPGGRIWTVSVVEHPETGGPPVLRFSAGSRVIDLKRWNRAWADEHDERLAEMLRDAAPRAPTTRFTPETPRRRWNDPPPPTPTSTTSRA